METTLEEIIIIGDMLPTPSNYKLFENGDVFTLLGTELFELIRKQKFYKIVNLEGPLTDSVNEIRKSGPVLKGTTRSVNGIKEMKIDICSLANNHILDYGIEGLQSTISVLEKNNIKHVGTGDNIYKAKEPYVVLINGVKVGIYACAEHEFTIATEHRAGANPFDALEIGDQIADLKLEVDYLIILYHGGKEYYRYPAPYVQKRCRKLIDKGADLVICQHSHCIGCKEEYNNGTIVYGQGNFLFDRGNNEFRNTGLIIKVNPLLRQIEYIPVVKKGNCVRLANWDEKSIILQQFAERSEEIRKKGIVVSKYREFAEDMIYTYDLWSLGIVGRILFKIKLGKLAKLLFRRIDSLAVINYLRCEAHSDLYIEGLKERLNID